MQVFSVAQFLPDIELASVPDGDSIPLRESAGKTSVLLTVHGADCSGCRGYIEQLTPVADEFDVWEARLLVIVPGTPDAAARLKTFGKILIDKESRVADPASASLTVADRYGQIFFAVRSGTSHDLPLPRELAEWLKYLGTLCPE